MSEENNDKPKDELDIIKEEMAKMREEMAEMRKNRGSEPRPPREPRPPHPPGNFFNFEFDDDDIEFEGFNPEELGETLNDYFGSVMEGISHNLRRSMADMTKGFRNLDFHAAEKARRKAEKVVRKQERQMEKAARRARRAAYRANRRGRRVHLHPLSPEELQEFLDDAPNILSALTDKRRLQILKILEGGAAYQGDITEKTDIKGGTFKHHMDILLNAKFVHQEATRGRYLITQLGIEGMKLAEILFRRNKYESKRGEFEDEYEEGIEVEIDDAGDEIDDIEDEIEDIADNLSDQIEDVADELEDISDDIEEEEDL